MDHVVHINNGSEKAEPLILHLLPGEEMKLDIKVVNHGAPSNISLKASNDIAKAVRTDKPDHYLSGEEIIPILARMPDVNRLEGEILFTGERGQSRLPIIFIKDSEDPDDVPEKDEETSYSEENDEEADPDEDDQEIKRSDDSEESEDTSRIKFSRDKDLQRYRASRIRRANAEHKDSSGREIENRDIDNRDIDRRDVDRRDVDRRDVDRRDVDRRDVDRRDVDRRDVDRRDVDRRDVDRRDVDRRDLDNRDRDSGYRDMEYRNAEYGASGFVDSDVDSEDEKQIETASRNVPDYGLLDSIEINDSEAAEVPEERDNGFKARLFELTGDKSVLLAMPAVMLITLIALLILTFYSESIPEFTGALASAMLIVTLIIYGAATLLKA